MPSKGWAKQWFRWFFFALFKLKWVCRTVLHLTYLLLCESQSLSGTSVIFKHYWGRMRCLRWDCFVLCHDTTIAHCPFWNGTALSLLTKRYLLFWPESCQRMDVSIGNSLTQCSVWLISTTTTRHLGLKSGVWKSSDNFCFWCLCEIMAPFAWNVLFWQQEKEWGKGKLSLLA